jgi:unsaturated rhamnogalacturonyl hydrolase
MRLLGDAESTADDVYAAIKLAAQWCEQVQYRRWFWGEALAFDALVLAGEVAGVEPLLALADSLLGTWPSQMSTRMPQHSDVHAPLRTMIRLGQTTGRAGYLSAAVKVAEYLVSAPAFNGAYLHHLEGYPPMVFVDFIYYVGPYLGLLSQVTGDPTLLNTAVTQTLGHLECLQDPTNGLARHVYDPARAETNGVAWGRGNGWALLGLVDTLEVIPADHSGRASIEERFRHLLAACLEFQDASGLWHTILNDSESPLENSISAFFYAALAKARRLGFASDVDESAARAWRATFCRMRPDGQFPISMTEWPDWDPNAYYRRQIGTNPWGQGCFLRAASEFLISSGHAKPPIRSRGST